MNEFDGSITDGRSVVAVAFAVPFRAIVGWCVAVRLGSIPWPLASLLGVVKECAIHVPCVLEPRV